MFPALHLENLHKTFPPRNKGGEVLKAVQGLTLEIQPGEIFALLGPNGAGKSTTIGMISGLTRPTKGSAQVFGKDVTLDYKATRQMVGLVPQEVNFDPFFTPREALDIQAGLFNVEKKDRWTDEILKRLSLTSVADTSVRKLSGGMKRRLLVGKALVHRPKLLILDEPTAGVDVELRRELWDFVRELNQAGTTILLTTHHMEEVEALSGRIAIMAKGQLKALDTLQGHKQATGLDKLEDIYLKYTSTEA
jgi:ABC-2 type transport system ATP-binding protein